MRTPVRRRRSMSGPRRASSNANRMNRARVQGRQQAPSRVRQPSSPPMQVQNTLGAAQRQVGQRQQQRRSMVPLNPADNRINASNAQMATQNNAPKTTSQYSKGGAVHTDYRKDGLFKK